MLYLIHDDSGKISQANKVYHPEGYDSQLNELGMKFVKLNINGLLSSEDFYIHGGDVARRPEMQINRNKTVIQAGTNDAAVFSGIDVGTRVVVTIDGYESTSLFEATVDDGILEFSAPSAGSYTITFEKFPFITKTMKVVAQ